MFDRFAESYARINDDLLGPHARIEGDSDTIEETWRAGPDWIYSLAVSPDGATLASGDWAGNVRVQEIKGSEK